MIDIHLNVRDVGNGNDLIEWDPANPGLVGSYRLKADGKFVSSSYDGLKSSWKVKRTPKQEYELWVFGPQIGLGVYPQETPPPSLFGAKIPRPFPEIQGTPIVCRTAAELAAAAAKTGPTVIEIVGTIAVGVNVPLNNDTYVYGTNRTKDGISGGRFLIDAQRVRVRNVGITKSVYDGVKIGDNKPAYNVDIDGCWIRDVGDQGVLTGFKTTSDIWVRNCLIENVGTTSPPAPAAAGHCIYTGGPTSKWTIQRNILRPRAFGVQCYPNPADVLVTQNTIEGGVTRGGTVTAADANGVRYVGNLISGAPSAAFEVWPTPAASTADDNLVVGSPVWAAGLARLPGGNTVAGTMSQAEGFVRQQSFDWTLSADAGAA